MNYKGETNIETTPLKLIRSRSSPINTPINTSTNTTIKTLPTRIMESRNTSSNIVHGGGINQEDVDIKSEAVRNLERQRQELQRQQQLEIQRFKQKKEEIIKLSNRKKEIELMRSIEAEKNKLRIIHHKQQELNNIYQATVEQSQQPTSLHGNSQNGGNGGNGGNTIKHIITQPDNVDAKRTKKNNLDKKDIASSILNTSNKTNRPEYKDAVVMDTSNHNTQEPIKEPVKANKNEIKETTDTKDTKQTKQVKQVKKLKEGEPLEYYSKKDKPELKWPTKTELYDASTYENPLDVYLATPLLLSPKQKKIKINITEIKKILKNENGFKNVEHFKEPLLDILYRIINYDIMNFKFE